MTSKKGKLLLQATQFDALAASIGTSGRTVEKFPGIGVISALGTWAEKLCGNAGNEAARNEPLAVGAEVVA
jgi:hypothetical protein